MEKKINFQDRKIKLLIGVMAVLLVFVILIIMLAGNNEPVDVAAEFTSLCTAAKDGDFDAFSTSAKRLNIDDESRGDSLLTENFLNNYIDENSVKKYMKVYLDIDLYLKEYYEEISFKDSVRELMSSITDPYVESFNVKKFAGKSGYYSNHPNAKPKASTEKVSGTFNRPPTMEVYTDTRTNTTKVEYYGDFALKKTHEYVYNEGEYGWYGGTFHDELSSWSEENTKAWYFKGEFLGNEKPSVVRVLEKSGKASYYLIKNNGEIIWF